jgi:hypothetical protein
MTVSLKANLYTLVTIICGLITEIGVVQAAIYFDKVLLLYVFGPLVLFFGVLVWIFKVTGIRCPSCNNIYGVALGQRGWPSVPKNCLSCGKHANG